MAYYLLLTIFFALVFDVHSEQCSNLYLEPNFQESQCLATKTWYVYAASKPGENCCVRRTLSKSSPNTMDITEVLKNFNNIFCGTSFTVEKFTVAQIKTNPIYNIGEGDFYFVLTGTDCVNSVVFYDTKDDELIVFSYQLNPGPAFLPSLKGVKECGLKLYHYSPEINCEGL